MKFIDKVCDKLGLLNKDEPDDAGEDVVETKAPEPQAKPAFDAIKMPSPPPTAAPAPTPTPNYFGNKVVDFHAAAERRESAMNMNVKSKINTIKPKNFDDAQIVANCLRDKIPVIINFEQTDPNDARRIIDFISGTTYALNGAIKKVNDTVFICAPSNVHVAVGDEEKRAAGSGMPWLNNQ